ncbi:MAG: trypsin-like serine protease [bacterium]|nr:trypsin-like serine protease [bacterium]
MSFIRGNSGVLWGLLVGIILGGALLGVRFGHHPSQWFTGNETVPSENTVEKPVDENGNSIGLDDSSHQNLGQERGNAIVQATRKVAPAVVSINVVQNKTVTDPSMALWQRMGLIPRREFTQQIQSMGSGVIISTDGLIVTNSHVLEGAMQVIVTLSDGQQFPARPVDRIDQFDLAVLKIEGEGFPVAHFARDNNLNIGEWAIAIGSPYGYLLADTQPTVTVGVISALNRDIKRSSGSNGSNNSKGSNSDRDYLGMIQTDAAINPGNSGGPLVNTAGEVIGINTFIFSDSGGSVGIGFAVPAARVQRVLQEIRKYGHYREINLGFTLQKLSPGMVQYFGLNDPVGFVVVAVLPGSPAWKAGLRPKDIVREVDGNILASTDVIHRLIYEAQVGDSLSFRAEREHNSFTGRILIEEAQ